MVQKCNAYFKRRLYPLKYGRNVMGMYRNVSRKGAYVIFHKSYVFAAAIADAAYFHKTNFTFQNRKRVYAYITPVVFNDRNVEWF